MVITGSSMTIFFYVIDTDGMIKSQYDADKVADYGGGYTWLEEEENVSWDDAGFWKYTLYSPEGGEVCDYTVSNQDLENLSFKRSYMGDGKFLYKKNGRYERSLCSG